MLSVSHLSSQPECIINCVLRPYEMEGLNWLIGQYNAGMNCIMADEEGVNESLQTIALLGYLFESRAIDGITCFLI